MENAGNYALRNSITTNTHRLASALASVLTTVGVDMGAGALSAAKLIVVSSGCVALLGAGVLVGSADARALLLSRLPTPPAIVVAQNDQGPAVAPQQPAPVLMADPQQKRIVQYLVRRYRVADEAVRQLVSAAFQIGKEKNLDPLLILSVVAIESSLNPFAQSSMGAQGLMQVMTRVHADRFEPHGGETAALDPIANMKVGSSILHELISRGGSVERGLQLYVGAGNMPDDGGYGARVLGERGRLQLAAAGKVDTAIAAAIRAAAPPPTAPESKQVSIELSNENSAPAESTSLQSLPGSSGESQRSTQSEQTV